MSERPDRRRRQLLAAAAASSLFGVAVAPAQPRAGVARVAFSARMPEDVRARVREILAKAGFEPGRNLRLEYYPIAGGSPDAAEARAREMIAARPDAIFHRMAPMVFLLSHLTRDIPIIFHNCAFDPARGGLIESVARPGGNITGTYHDSKTLRLKGWALFKEIVPSLRRAAWLRSADGFEAPRWPNRNAFAAAHAFGRESLAQEREGFAVAEREFGIRIAEIVVPAGATEEQMIEAVRRERPEAIRFHRDRDFPENGALEKYLVSARILTEGVVRTGRHPTESFDTAVEMLARVLKGERPANLPAIQDTRYYVKLNPRLAKEMGIAIPHSVLLQAEAIED